MISFGKDICTKFDEASSREWLEANGIGGFASSTVTGMNTRRYHGLLVAATHPPVGRMVLVSKLEETLISDAGRVELSTNRYEGVIHPRGYERLIGFRLDPWPVYTYEVAGMLLEKSVLMVHGSNTTIVIYKAIDARSSHPLRLEVRPLIAARDYHATTHENGAIGGQVDQQQNLLTLHPYEGIPSIHIAHNAAAVADQGYWYRGFVYSVERERGLDFREDLFNPLMLEFDLERGAAYLVLSTERRNVHDVPALVESESTRRAAVITASPAQDDFSRALTAAADQFIVERGTGHTIIAGYPWFTDWGRDTMVSLPGLTLNTGRFDVARTILSTFAKHVSEGMLPNLFGDDGTSSEYNTADASLWYFESVRAYLEATGDIDFARQLYPVLADIVDWHIRGTRFGIRVQEDGLLHAGAPGVQLTWMDAKVGDKVITPRSGKPVELQALWFNALRTMVDLASQFGDQALQRKCEDVSARLQFSFNRMFWNATAECLYDVVDGGQPDAAIRPNQLFAVSLPHSMLSPERALSVVRVVERDLLTPLGLRTLSTNDPAFAPKYEGGPAERDSNYHQGTIWPWLLGPFVRAYLKVNGYSEASRRCCADFLSPMILHLSEAGLGQISEICDATAPYAPRGCFAQAWSVAEILRAHAEVARAGNQRQPNPSPRRQARRVSTVA